MDILPLLREVVDREASDLHIVVGSPPMFRVYGSLVALDADPLNEEETQALVADILSDEQYARLQEDLEVDFGVAIESLGRFRGNAHHTNGHIEAAFRLIPETIPEIATLGHGDTVSAFCDRHQGLVLVTGVTGSGKTTTLASMATQILNSRPVSLVTIEDPIEYRLAHGQGIVKQRQIGTDTHSFANALRASLRQDPDVIIVAELRDYETIRTAITAAETGHLVIATVHTLDAPKSLDRIIDVFPPDQQRQIITQIANCLVGIVSQRLIPRADGPGRVLASEVMVANDAVRAAIHERRFEQLLSLIEIGRQDGMHTIDASLAHLFKGGFILPEHAMNLCRDREYMYEAITSNAR